MQRPTAWFRMSFWWFSVVCCLWAVPIASLILIGIYAISLPGRGFAGPAPTALVAGLLAGIVAGEVATFLLVLPVVLYYTTGVGPEGIRGFNFWGIYRDALWEDFRSVSPINFLGLRFLRAHTARGWGPLWLPIFLTDWERFRDLVLEYAGPEHPFSRAICEEVG
jgi:hypothetical protein